MSLEGIGPSLAVMGSTTAGVFEVYVEKVLAPSLRFGQLVVVDNLSSHKGKRVRELIEARGCELFYLPPHSPQLWGGSRTGVIRYKKSGSSPSVSGTMRPGLRASLNLKRTFSESTAEMPSSR